MKRGETGSEPEKCAQKTKYAPFLHNHNPLIPESESVA
jgi:hypothetical protein